MRYTVRDVEPPYDPIGYVPGPPPDALVAAKFRWSFPLSKYMNDHPAHFTSPTGETVEMELGAYEHEKTCVCKECRNGNRPRRQMCFMAAHVKGKATRLAVTVEVHPVRGVAISPTDYVRRIIGFHPVAVRRVEPTTVSGGTSNA